jgi:hypothetical protein
MNTQQAISALIAGADADSVISELLEASRETEYRKEYKVLAKQHGHPYGPEPLSQQGAKAFSDLKKKHGVRSSTQKRSWIVTKQSNLGHTYKTTHHETVPYKH